MSDREPVRVDGRAAQQKTDRAQRHEIRRIFVEADFVRIAIMFLPDRGYFGCRDGAVQRLRVVHRLEVAGERAECCQPHSN